MRRPFRRPAVTGAIFVALMMLASCSSGPTIITNSAPGFEVANFQTFGYLRPLSTDQGNVRTLISTHLVEATTRELESRGLSRVDDNPDLLVNFVVSTRETLQTRPSSSVSMHHGRGRYGTWGGYSWGMSTTEVVQRTEGTIGVDIIDPAAMSLVWEGAASGRVTDQVRRNVQQVVDVAIADIFAQFP